MKLFPQKFHFAIKKSLHRKLYLTKIHKTQGVCMTKVKQLLSFLMAAVILFSYQSIFAQTTTASINGLVVDQNGNALPGANIIAVHEPSGSQYGSTSREDGRYNLVGLRVGGPYKVTVSYVGYTQQVEEGFSLALGQNLRIDFKLPEQAVQLSGVTVTAERGAILSQARTGATTNVSTKNIQEIPTTSRQFQNFAKLSPLFSGEGLNAAGRSSKYNNIQIDGTQHNDLFGLGSTGTPGGQVNTAPISLDAISEFQILVAPYDVRQSGFTGGGINAITKSGSNNFSGSAYFYGRNEKLVGNYKSESYESKDYDEFKEFQTGITLGGPIIKDKLFFFLSGEMTANDQPSPNYSLMEGYGGKTPDELRALGDQVAAALAAKGYNPGTYSDVTLEQPSTKLFLRFDYNLAENHKLTLRHNYVDASADKFYNYRQKYNLLYDSQPYQMTSTTNSTALQLNSTFGNTMSNELIVGYTTIRDARKGISADAPEVLIKEMNRTFSFYFGPDRYSSANKLDQDILEITDNFNIFMGDHTFTIGTHNEFFKFSNLFARSAFGYYEYNSLSDFNADKASYYQRVYSRKGDPRNPNSLVPAEFSVAQFGLYVQDEWTVSPRLKLTVGLRVDMPTFPDTPDENPLVPQYFPGYKTNQVPDGNLLWSPRFGFNYDLSGDRTTQLRGGLGIFTGRIPYVWMSNNFGNSGTLMAEVNNGSGTNVKFNPNPYSQYIAGDPGTPASPKLTSEVDLADPDLKLPQVMRFNLGIDHQLPWGFVGTAEFLYSKNLNEMLYRKLNLKAPVGKVGGVGTSNENRPLYGGTDNGGGNFLDVLELYNTSSGYQYNLVFQVQRNVNLGLSVNAGYAYGNSKDKNSLNSSQAQSQMRYSPIDMDPNNPSLTTSQYEIKHRVFASVSYRAMFIENAPTTISLFYNGQSGMPYSYIVRGDLNADGFDRNDLFYIPRNSSEILLGTVSSGQYVPASAQNYADFENFIKNDEYLSANRGKISERNGAREPWQEYFDLTVAQDIPDLWGMGRFQVRLDILNVLNLLNKEWGINKSAGAGTYETVVLQQRITHNGKANTPVYSFSKPNNNEAAQASDYSSRWKMMLGIRYSF
jgi:outer membrane receptor protein involved in Fe transport